VAAAPSPLRHRRRTGSWTRAAAVCLPRRQGGLNEGLKTGLEASDRLTNTFSDGSQGEPPQLPAWRTYTTERCPRCQSGALRMIAAITSRPVLFHILASHLAPSQAGGRPTAPSTGPLGARTLRLSLCLNQLVGTRFSSPKQGRGASAWSDARDRLTRRITSRGLRGTDGASAQLTQGGSRP
jgi:hypothetical protein